MATKVKIKKGDTVRVTAGSQKGKEGNIIKVFHETNRAIVGGVNMVKKHNKPNAQNPQGGISEKEASIHISNLSLLTSEGKITRVGYRIDDHNKVRFSKKTDEAI